MSSIFLTNFFLTLSNKKYIVLAMINTELLEQRRKELKISKYKMADLLDMSRQSYYAIIVKKSARLSTLDKIAKILDISTKDLLQ